METLISGRPLVAGEVQGEVLVSTEPLSFWGGYDQKSGEIIDRRHELSGYSAAGRILAIPGTRGSSTTTAVLLEAVRLKTAPIALLTIGADTFLSLAAVVAEELYNHTMPVLALVAEEYALLRSGDRLRITEEGEIWIEGRP